jgi:hypothetical protein
MIATANSGDFVGRRFIFAHGNLAQAHTLYGAQSRAFVTVNRICSGNIDVKQGSFPKLA